MIKYKKFKTSHPTAESNLDDVLKEVNEFLTEKPERKLINIEHVVSKSETTYGYDSFFICLWYSE